MPVGSPVLTQAVTFAFVALTGCAVGLSFDVYRALRSVRRLGRLAGDLADGAYGVLAAALVAVGLLGAAWGEIRLYSLLGLGVGAAAYFLLASPALLPAMRGAAGGVHRLWVRTSRLVLRPARWSGRRLAAAATGLGRALRRLDRREASNSDADEGGVPTPDVPSGRASVERPGTAARPSGGTRPKRRSDTGRRPRR